MDERHWTDNQERQGRDPCPATADATRHSACEDRGKQHEKRRAKAGAERRAIIREGKVLIAGDAA